MRDYYSRPAVIQQGVGIGAGRWRPRVSSACARRFLKFAPTKTTDWPNWKASGLRSTRTGRLRRKFELAFAAARRPRPDTRGDGRTLPLPANLSAILRVEPSKRTAAQQKESDKGSACYLREQSLRFVFERSGGSVYLSRLVSSRARSSVIRTTRVRRGDGDGDDKPRDTFMLDRGNYLKPESDIRHAWHLPAASQGCATGSVLRNGCFCRSIPSRPASRPNRMPTLLRHRAGGDGGASSALKRDADAAATARLARGGISRIGLEDEGTIG